MNFKPQHIAHSRLLRFHILAIVWLILAGNAFAEDYYWVGGSGYWSDINHWATTSGGAVLHIQAPTADDDVIFDANSFSGNENTMTINQKNAVCHNMTWAGVSNAPIMAGDDTTSLRIYGSLTLVENMLLDYHGILFFEATSPGQTITSAGNTFLSTMIFQGTGGGWILADDFASIGAIFMIRGTFDTGSNNLSCIRFESTGSGPRTILLGTSLVTLEYWKINATNLILDADQSEFAVRTLMITESGSRVIYNNVVFTDLEGSLVSDNVHTVYNIVQFAAGTVSGTCTIDSLLFQSTGRVAGSDSINYVLCGGYGSFTGDHHVIGFLQTLGPCEINGNHRVDTTLVSLGAAFIGNNVMDTVYCCRNAGIIGSNAIQQITVTTDADIDGTNTFGYALLNGDSHISGQNIFDTLDCTAGRTYTFGSFSTTTINESFHATGTCNEPIRMLSDTNGVQAVIVKNNGPFVSEFLSLRDLKAEGSTPFVAAHSVDRGNNTGWDIETTGGIDLYWVNGGGFWSDNNHWDENSGGPGGHCPPTEIDNAIFDEQSFNASGQEVFIRVKNAVCHDMNWENALNHSALLNGADTTKLRINGSLYFNEVMINGFPGPVYFESVDSGEIIRSANQKFFNSVYFNGRGGYWDFEDDIEVIEDINFELGGLRTRSNRVICQRFMSEDTTTRYLNLGESTVNLKQNGLTWSLSGIKLTLHADSSLLKALMPAAVIKSFNAPIFNPLIYNNVEFHGLGSLLRNKNAFCVYNLVTFFQDNSEIRGDCKIDTATFHKTKSTIYDNDTIKTAIFYDSAAHIRGGKHVVEIAYFYSNGKITGNNIVDTALFYRNAVIADTNLIDTTIVYNKSAVSGLNQIRTATLIGDGTIDGINTFGDLTLGRASTYYFEHDKTQTVTNRLNLQGACTGPIILQSDENTHQATIHKTGGPVEGDYLSLRDMKATGTQLPFRAYNSTDLGNNSGWEISTSDPKELYWVNGNGVWSDSLHWSDTPGGDGGYCIPTPIDNVYFDENSFVNNFDSVWIDLTNATCHNMNWTGALPTATLAGPDTNNLRIYGSLKLNKQMYYHFTGPLYFETTESGHTIESQGVMIISESTFQGIGGEWMLVDSLYISGGINFKHGSLDLNQQKMRTAFFNSNYTTPRHLDISNAKIIITEINMDAWHLNTQNLDFSGAHSLITFTGFNGLMRTEGGIGIRYHNVYFNTGMSRIYNISTHNFYHHVSYEGNGSVHGNCSIDTLIISGSGTINDSDTIQYAHIRGLNGDLLGGRHVVNTILFDINGQISGNNSIDSTIIYGNGQITGTNTINKTLIIGKKATISGENNFNRTILMGNGRINDPNDFVSLKFTPGNIYELEENITQSISEDFIARGNNCFPITIRSQTEGEQAMISVPAGKIVSGDFLELRDIAATGGAVFYAGNFSTDISNNEGWQFTNAPGYIYGFAGDTTVCEADYPVIGTQNFNPDKNSTFLWHDGSTASGYAVKPGDTMAWVTVFYANDCAYTDSIDINWLPSPFVELGDDITLCSMDTLYPLQFSADADMQWMDGSTKDYIITTGSGFYGLTLTNQYGCTASDELYVDVIPAPVVDLGNDTILHPGETITLDAGNSGDEIYWSTGDTTRSITAGSKQTYWVSVNRNGCMAFDTITIDEYPPCVIAVPTAFSPNGDGINDILFVRGQNFTDFELMIFNRWGELIFNTTDTSLGWDGTYQGKPQPVDTYNYYLKGKCVDGQFSAHKGTITLLR